MSANENNVSFRQGVGGLDRPLTYEELDENFRQLRDVILDTQDIQLDVNDKYNKARETNTHKLLQLSKSYLDSLTVLPSTIEDIITIVGENVVIPAATEFYASTLIVLDQQIQFNSYLLGRSTGVVRYKVNAFTATGTPITVGTYSINGVDKVFSAGFDAGDANGNAIITIDPSQVASVSYIQLEIRTGTTQSNFHSLNVEYTKGWYE